MGVGNNNPLEMLDVSGAIKIGTTAAVPAGGAGTIRWNGTNFEGWDGTQWIPFDGSGAIQILSISGSNLSLSNGGGTVALPNGSSLTDNDNDTKVQVEEGTDEDQIRFDTQGTERMVIDATGNVGVGTTVAVRQLHLESATGAQMLLNRGSGTVTTDQVFGEILFDSDDNAISAVDAAAIIRGSASQDQGNTNKGGYLSFLTKNNVAGGANATERVRISANGNVGIGVVNPQSLLHLKSNSSNNSSGLRFSSNTANAVIHLNGFNDLVLGKFNIPNHLVLDASGNVGIGTNGPAEKLEVQGSIRMVDGNQSAGYIPVSDAGGTMVWTDPTTIATSYVDEIRDADSNTKIQVEENANEDIIRFDVGGSQAMVIDDNGRIGIGVDSPDKKLHLKDGSMEISHSTGPPSVSFQDDISGNRMTISYQRASDKLEIRDNSEVPRLVVENANGYVGMGLNVSPTQQLHVEGSIRMVDGNQTAGYIPVSDANGKMVWTDPATISGAISDEISDTDGDTKIEVEKTTDADQISFEIDGVERWLMNGVRLTPRNSGNSIFIGSNAGFSDDLTDNANVFVGYYAGRETVTGEDNIAIGSQALMNNQDGGSNLAFGNFSQWGRTTGQNNISLGGSALRFNVDGGHNIAFGTGALRANETGEQNIALGSNAGFNNVNGSGNVFLGYKAGQIELGSNKLYIENSNSSSPLIYGEFDNDIVGINGNLGVGTQSPQDELHVVGSIRMVDGNQTAGDIAVSDANGTMVWTDPTTIATSYVDEIRDADSNTKIQVEESIDEDIIRFDIGGTQRAQLAEDVSEIEIIAGFVQPQGLLRLDGYGLLLKGTGGNVGQVLTIEGQLPSSAYPYSRIDFRNTDNALYTGASIRSHNSGGSEDGDLRFFITSNQSLTEAMRIDYLGNIGVGITAPQEELHVEGSIRMVDGNQTAGDIAVSDANGTMVWTDPTTVSGAISDEISDADDNTKIQVEESANEDIIRFDLGGTEQFTMDGPHLGVHGSGQSVFIGQSAGTVDDLTDNDNTFIGYEVGSVNTSGFNNTAIGTRAYLNGNGELNTAVGNWALYSNTAGDRNTVVGSAAGQNILGDKNTIIGTLAGQGATGSENVYIGYTAGHSATGNNKLYIENSNSNTPLIYGEFDNDLIRVNGSFEAVDDFASAGQFVATIQNTNGGGYANGLEIQAGQNTQSVNNRFISFVKPNGSEIGAVRQTSSSGVDYNTTSDIRLKTNINPTTKGLTDLMQIEVKDYVYKEDLDKPQTGFIAQQVHTVYPNAVSAGGDDVKTDPWMMDYGKMTPLLVKAVQDLTKLVEAQQEANKALSQEVQLLKKQLQTK